MIWASLVNGLSSSRSRAIDLPLDVVGVEQVRPPVSVFIRATSPWSVVGDDEVLAVVA